jgi:hydrogenase maturation protein HypF
MSLLNLRIRGLVQGVGFRPYVWRLASELGLTGWVRNDGAGVTIAVDGQKLPEFLARLPREIPPLARIDAIETSAAPDEPWTEPTGFSILDSLPGSAHTAIGPDAAICVDCVANICDPADRRWRYAFTTCTHCGPRYSVSRGIPYDRAQTSLQPFPLCAACATEYAAPVDRRFHAETTCCPACGPQLRLLGASGSAVDGDPLAETLALLRAGKIVAIKGLGGFHLACDAKNAHAVGELRERKAREAKPFAVMGLNAASFSAWAQIGSPELALLHSAAAPIVLCPKGDNELPEVAPGLAWLGVMLPATPLHLLLWHEAAGRPAGTAWLAAANDMLLVMTSANPAGEPLVIDNDEALDRLAGIADAWLLHDRDIVVRSDDSVVRAASETLPALFIRRARGYAPLPIALRDDGPAVLALGGYLKNTLCVMRGREAFLSQHIGSLDNVPTLAFLEEVTAHLLKVLEVQPDLIAHDLHPDYPSTQMALRLADALGVPAVAVAHHHAHIAAICAEHGVNEPVIGLALDGAGLGADGGSWGGELLRVDGAACRRLGHLQPLALPGGDRAAREPWRMAVSALYAAGLGYRVAPWLQQHYPQHDGRSLLSMLERKLRCPLTSSLGRWFDAAAGLLGLRETNHYEGQAAMELESLAARHGPVAPLAGGYRCDPATGNLDFSPLVLALLDCREPALGAALFHATLAAGLANWVISSVDREKVSKIAIAGGCAMNSVLLHALHRQFAQAGLELLSARQAPPNDGGLALGQAWVARYSVAAV